MKQITVFFMLLILIINTLGYIVISRRLDKLYAGQIVIVDTIKAPKKFRVYYDPASDNKEEINMQEIREVE